MMTQSPTRLLLASRLPQASFHGHTCPRQREEGPSATAHAQQPSRLETGLNTCSSELRVPDVSTGGESACNAGDLGLIPGLGRSPGEGKGYPLQCSGLENPMDCIVHGVAESDTTEQLTLSPFFIIYIGLQRN